MSSNMNAVIKYGAFLFKFKHHWEFITLHEQLVSVCYCAEEFQKKKNKSEKTQLNRPQWTTFRWRVGGVSPLKWMESDTVHHSSPVKASPLAHAPLTHSQTAAQQQHSQLRPLNMLRLRSIPLYLLRTCAATTSATIGAGLESYLSTWSRFPDTPSPPMV